MTVRRNQADDAISNLVDRILSGVGKRSSSFIDIDALTHDGDTDRFLFQELKWSTEPWPESGQLWALQALSTVSSIDVWVVQIDLECGCVLWQDLACSRSASLRFSLYRRLFTAWWHQPTRYYTWRQRFM